jgi:hypothetical protein
MHKKISIPDSMMSTATIAGKTLQGASRELIRGYVFDSFHLHADGTLDDDTLVARLERIEAHLNLNDGR